MDRAPHAQHARAMAWLPLACGLASVGLGAAGCNRSEGGGVVVRQVLRGAEAVAPEPSVASRTSVGVERPGATQSIAPSGSTLVADTPQAIYRRALEQARRDDGSTGLKQRLSAVEADLEQQEEEEP